mmetsp:Transcript_28998/g.53029  ORF Transcript_28998/g.53029 Transcript_28998/m.53029 type:complete len:552 (-) Transcript_28998:494-2149(-)
MRIALIGITVYSDGGGGYRNWSRRGHNVMMLLLSLMLLFLLRSVKLLVNGRHLPPQIVHDEGIEAHDHGHVLHQLRMPQKHPRQRRARLGIPRLDLHDHLGVSADGRGRPQHVEEQRRTRPGLERTVHELLEGQVPHGPIAQWRRGIHAEPREVLVVRQYDALVLRQRDVALAQMHPVGPRRLVRHERILEGSHVASIVYAVKAAMGHEEGYVDRIDALDHAAEPLELLLPTVDEARVRVLVVPEVSAAEDGDVAHVVVEGGQPSKAFLLGADLLGSLLLLRIGRVLVRIVSLLDVQEDSQQCQSRLQTGQTSREIAGVHLRQQYGTEETRILAIELVELFDQFAQCLGVDEGRGMNVLEKTECFLGAFGRYGRDVHLKRCVWQGAAYDILVFICIFFLFVHAVWVVAGNTLKYLAPEQLHRPIEIPRSPLQRHPPLALESIPQKLQIQDLPVMIILLLLLPSSSNSSGSVGIAGIVVAVIPRNGHRRSLSLVGQLSHGRGEFRSGSGVERDGCRFVGCGCIRGELQVVDGVVDVVVDDVSVDVVVVVVGR